ncbi:MAG TPA: hypothetical protein VLF87_00885, partial [Patescibacteria group bacterium]|nr:hypothetical protein [Patescibacteria group bacterium]
AVIVFLFVTKERRWLLGAWLISGIATLLILNIILNNYYWYPQNYAGASVEYGCYLGELYTTNVQQRGTCIIRNIPNVLSETDAYNPAVGAFVILQLPLLSTPLGFELLKRVRRLNSQT